MTVGLLLSSAPASEVNNSRIVMNVLNGTNIWTNIAKGFLWQFGSTPGPDPAQSTSDGYPTGTLTQDWGSHTSIPPGYYGTYKWNWTGTASLFYSGSLVVINGGTAFGLPGNTGDIATNSTCSGTNVAVEVYFGWNIQSISQGASDGAGGHLIRVNVKTGYLNGGGVAGAAVNISGATATGANGTWTMASIDPTLTFFDLAGSTWVNNQVGAGGLAVITPIADFKFPSGATYTGFSNLQIYRSSQQSAITAGQITDPGYIAQLQYLMNSASRGNSGFLRFMDLSGVQGSFECDFANRWPATFLYYPLTGDAATRLVPNYLAGNNTGTSDAIACSDPSTSVWSGSAYLDNAIIHVKLSATNSTAFPTLNVGGHGAKPIYDTYFHPQFIGLSGPPASGGLTMTWTFTAAYLAGLPGVSGTTYTLHYTSSAGATGHMAKSGTNQITVTSLSGTLAVGQVLNNAQFPIVLVSSVGGGVWNVNTTSNLDATGIAFVVFDDTAVLSNFSFNFQSIINGDATLTAAAIACSNPGIGVQIYCPTAQAGRLSIAYASGPAGLSTVSLLPANSLATGYCTFVYNYLIDGWLYFGNEGILQSTPIETFVEMCNLTNSHCYYCWGITKGSFVTAVTNYFATNLNPGLKFATEVFNEVWNPGAAFLYRLSTLGTALGWNYASGGPNLGYTGLRTIQYGALSRAAWASASRAASDHLVLQMSQGSDFTLANNTPVYQFAGTNLDASANTFYANYGQLNGTGTAIPTGSSGYNQVGHRPIDITDGIGYAPYWASPWLGAVAGSLVGTVVANAPLLQASLDYANGSHTTAFTSLVNQFNGTTQRTDGNYAGNPIGYHYTVSNSNFWYTIFGGFESIAAHYDNSVGANLRYNGLPNLSIIHYEGGPQFGSGANYVSGVNSVNSQDVQALAAQMSAIGWGLSATAYTQSGGPLSIASGTYNNTTGAVTLTLTASNPNISGVAFSSARLYLSGGSMVVDASGGTITGNVNAGMTVTGAGVPANTVIIGPHPTTVNAWYITGGVVTVGPEAMTVGDTVTISSLTGSGTNLASLNGTFQTIVTTSGTTLTYQAASGLGSITITGGTAFDANATFTEIATNIFTMLQAWKFDVSYKNFIKDSYYQMLVNISGINREVHPAQYGYQANNWGVFPVAYELTGTQYTNYDAIHEWDA